MQSAISSGAPEEVTALLAILESMNKAAISRELTGCYGGRRGNPPRVDEDGLFRMTIPLLHAAFTGSTRMFNTVLGAMRAKLRAPQARRREPDRKPRAVGVPGVVQALSTRYTTISNLRKARVVDLRHRQKLRCATCNCFPGQTSINITRWALANSPDDGTREQERGFVQRCSSCCRGRPDQG